MAGLFPDKYKGRYTNVYLRQKQKLARVSQLLPKGNKTELKESRKFLDSGDRPYRNPGKDGRENEEQEH
jgi:hypothetical protein